MVSHFILLITFILPSVNQIYSVPIPDEVDNELISPIKPLENPDLFLGDIKFRENNTGQNDGFLFKNAIKHEDQLWPYGRVPIVFNLDLGDISKIILDAIDEFHAKTCIRFVNRTYENDYVMFICDEGCYSYVGRLGGRQVISLGDGCHCRGTAIHEIMHALGFYHEHNRSDRDDYVEIDYDNIEPGAESMFIKLSPDRNRLFTKYDYDSIMQYDGTAFSKGPDLQTMIPIDNGVTLRHPCEKGKLSVKDVEKIKKLYSC